MDIKARFKKLKRTEAIFETATIVVMSTSQIYVWIKVFYYGAQYEAPSEFFSLLMYPVLTLISIAIGIPILLIIQGMYRYLRKTLFRTWFVEICGDYVKIHGTVRVVDRDYVEGWFRKWLPDYRVDFSGKGAKECDCVFVAFLKQGRGIGVTTDWQKVSTS